MHPDTNHVALGDRRILLENIKWIIIPLLLILVMIYRPTGLIAFKEFNIRNIIKPRQVTDKEV